MAVINPPMDTALAVRENWRDRIHITRMGIFSVFFILVGLWMLISAPQTIASDTMTRLTFGTNADGTPVLPELPINTLSYAVIVGILYLAGGIVGLIPLSTIERLKNYSSLERLKTWWLLLDGLLIIPTVLVIIAAGGSTNVTVMLQVSVRLATPVVMGALAGIWCERSGVTNIGIEGMMLTGACFGFVAFTLLVEGGMQSSPALWLGVVAATISGGVMAALHAWLSITYKTNQVVSGTVINILAVGLTSFVRREVLLSSQAGRETLQQIPLGPLAKIPVLGDVFFNGRPVFYAMFILLVITHVMLFYTRWGLRVRAVGENPHAADTLGINVERTRWINVVIGGLIAGLAGAWFSLETTGSFDDNMTSGRGFIALAAMIFGKWTPAGAFAGGLLFGFSDSLGQRIQFLGVNIPPQFLQMVPYVMTIIVVAGLVGKAVAPKADGVPYIKEGN
jgi:general nucleoside transport system permease protein